MIKVLIVDDHPIVQEGFKQILAETPDIKYVDVADSGNEAIDKIREKHYDVIVLDISLPDISGLDVLQLVKIEKPDIPVLVLSIYPEKIYGIQTLKAGASGYITKESAPQELITAIRTLVSGRKYISPSMGEILADELEKDITKLPHERLSEQEYKVFYLIAKGKTLRQISNELCLSIKTVSTYKSRILRKLNMKSGSEIIYYAVTNGLIK